MIADSGPVENDSRSIGRPKFRLLSLEEVRAISGAPAACAWLEGLGADRAYFAPRRGAKYALRDISDTILSASPSVAGAGAVEPGPLPKTPGDAEKDFHKTFLVALVLSESAAPRPYAPAFAQLALRPRVEDAAGGTKGLAFRRFRCSYYDIGTKSPVGVEIASGSTLVLSPPCVDSGVLIFIEPA